MKSCLIGLAILALPALAAAQPAGYGYPSYDPRTRAYDEASGWNQTDRAYDDQGYDDEVAARSDRPPPYGLSPGDGPADRPGYYRDFWPAPQYGYTYGSARGRGYGYSTVDDWPYQPPPPPYYPAPARDYRSR
jgi:hypothetical protein